MLELKQIVKHYPVGDRPVEALRGVSLKFRKSEFVSVLGPSGCGKTTLLNIIGGLDQYTSGDLIINKKSTKDFKDRDWDTYRNHSIGFVFQTYNLIPHQSVLQNVEIALTISGVSRQKRRTRAIEALKQVGLEDQIYKQPNQISGGQMQRVAIARALVNDPEIILADEPTGALDTETGIQVMEVLKKVASDRLVIMVTHNPLLAQRYSSRIIQMLDGLIVSDSSPVEHELEVIPKPAGKKPSMSFFTAFMLSLKNLFTKKGRTMLTAFAGSIGIMGIALILAVSQGTTNYIDAVQQDALSSYPLTIQKTTVDLSTLMETFMNVGNPDITHENDAVYKKTSVYDMITALNNIQSSENDLKTFKVYLEQEYEKPDDEGLSVALTGLQYSYDLDLNLYTKSVDDNILKSDTRKLLSELMAEHMGADMSAMSSMRELSPFSSAMSSFSSMGPMSMNLWSEILPGKNKDPVNKVVKNQYDVIYGTWPDSYDEIVLVLDENNELDDITLYALGLESKENIDRIMSAAVKGVKTEYVESRWSYQEIVDREYRVILNSDCYVYDENTGLYTDLRSTDAGLRYLYDNAIVLKVTGIVKPDENAQSTMISGAIGYTSALTGYIVEKSGQSSVIAAQLDSETQDIFSGLPFKTNTGNLTRQEKKDELYEYLSTSDRNKKAEAYIKIMSIPEPEETEAFVQQTMKEYTRADIEAAMLENLSDSMSVDKDTVEKYIASMSDDEINELFALSIEQRYKAQYAEQVQSRLSQMDVAQLGAMLDRALTSYTLDEYEAYYDEIMEFSDSTYEDNLVALGYVDLQDPEAINIFASSFSNKKIIEDAIKEYNRDKSELSQIKYTDYLGIMMKSITSILNAITYVLLAFVAISLIVSSIMIGVITLISVQERTKEIGILRAIGASKGDVSSMFNAETVIIGFTSGILGIGVTYLLCIPINLLLHKLTGIATLSAYLPVDAAVILVGISIVLSLIAGLIPSRSAAKKDPVVALRTE